VSHQSGRDADIGIYATDLDGQAVNAPGFPKFNGARGPLLDTTGAYLFDVVRNWAFVEALIQSKVARIQWIFLDTPLKEALLDHAVRTEVEPSIIDRAEKVIVRPKNSSPHANHYHIRIFCTDADTADPIASKYACRDYGPEWEWVKKERETGELLLQDQVDRIMSGELDLDLNPVGTPRPTTSANPVSPEQLQDPPTTIQIKL
jgi:penicillin-insensitive murein endopeptidase